MLEPRVVPTSSVNSPYLDVGVSRAIDLARRSHVIDDATRGTMLVIGGDESTDRLLLRILRIDGYDVECVPDRAAALAAIGAREPRLITVIANPPGDDALELCRELRMREPTRRTPIMILTAVRSLDLRVAAVTAGVDEFLVKPYTAQRLRARLQSLTQVDRSILNRAAMRRGTR